MPFSKAVQSTSFSRKSFRSIQPHGYCSVFAPFSLDLQNQRPGSSYFDESKRLAAVLFAERYQNAFSCWFLRSDGVGYSSAGELSCVEKRRPILQALLFIVRVCPKMAWKVDAVVSWNTGIRADLGS